MTTSRPARVWAEVTGGDALGRGHQPALSWWLPAGSSVQHAYQVRTDDGFDTGRVESAVQSFVRVPVFDTALGLYEAFIDGQRVGDAELTPGYTRTGRAGGWWRREFVREDGTLVVQSQASHVRALAFGLVPAESRPAVASRLAGLVATTVWELWEGVDPGGAPHASLNHYSKGTVASFLHRYVAGLRPVGAGYRTFEVRPRPGGGITSASARHISPFGPIEVSWRVRGEAFELDVLVPPGTTASVVLPGEAARDAHPGRHHWAGAAG